MTRIDRVLTNRRILLKVYRLNLIAWFSFWVFCFVLKSRDRYADLCTAAGVRRQAKRSFNLGGSECVRPRVRLFRTVCRSGRRRWMKREDFLALSRAAPSLDSHSTPF